MDKMGTVSVGSWAKIRRLRRQIHCADGPAVEWVDGTNEWWLYGKHYPFDRWLEIVPNLSDEEKVMLKLQYG